MAARVNYSVATLSAAASGRRLPTLEVALDMTFTFADI
jgi:hypothetical protein